MYLKGDSPHGMDKCALRFTDEHPLVQWIEASLKRKDINEQLHRGGDSPHADFRRTDGHNTGQTWVAGKQVPGPRVGTTLMSASQAMDNSAVSYMEAMEEFLCAAGLDQSQCSGP